MHNNFSKLPLVYISLIHKNKYYYLGAFFMLISLLLLYFNLEKGQALIWIAEKRTPFFDFIMPHLTRLGEVYTYIFMTIFFFLKREKWHSLFMALTGIIALLFVWALKYFFAHPRPKIYFEYILQLPDKISTIPNVVLQDSWINSFPSGHSTSAFAFFTFLAFYSSANVLKFVYLLIAFIVAFTRLYLFQHFLQDIIAGMILGIIVASFMYGILLYFKQKPYSLSQKNK